MAVPPLSRASVSAPHSKAGLNAPLSWLPHRAEDGMARGSWEVGRGREGRGWGMDCAQRNEPKVELIKGREAVKETGVLFCFFSSKTTACVMYSGGSGVKQGQILEQGWANFLY